ncbi:hypothetical protein B0O99DRAFT_597631 [Bisporella sp. PMI_857]|nr:hypothetical protein B0O99DRAFT_597631 [Bisporella sp. PMI_857]
MPTIPGLRMPQDYNKLNQSFTKYDEAWRATSLKGSRLSDSYYPQINHTSCISPNFPSTQPNKLSCQSPCGIKTCNLRDLMGLPKAPATTSLSHQGLGLPNISELPAPTLSQLSVTGLSELREDDCSYVTSTNPSDTKSLSQALERSARTTRSGVHLETRKRDGHLNPEIGTLEELRSRLTTVFPTRLDKHWLKAQRNILRLISKELIREPLTTNLYSSVERKTNSNVLKATTAGVELAKPKFYYATKQREEQGAQVNNGSERKRDREDQDVEQSQQKKRLQLEARHETAEVILGDSEVTIEEESGKDQRPEKIQGNKNESKDDVKPVATERTEVMAEIAKIVASANRIQQQMNLSNGQKRVRGEQRDEWDSDTEHQKKRRTPATYLLAFSAMTSKQTKTRATLVSGIEQRGMGDMSGVSDMAGADKFTPLKGSTRVTLLVC